MKVHNKHELLIWLDGLLSAITNDDEKIWIEQAIWQIENNFEEQEKITTQENQANNKYRVYYKFALGGYFLRGKKIKSPTESWIYFSPYYETDNKDIIDFIENSPYFGTEIIKINDNHTPWQQIMSMLDRKRKLTKQSV